MDVYKSDDEQVETIKKWWNENGKSIVFGVILGLGAIFGWRYWQSYQLQQAETASLLYQNLAGAISQDVNSIEVDTIGNKIVNDFGSTAYAIFTSLIQAKLAADDGNYEMAETRLRQAMEINDNPSIEHLIRIRLANVLLVQERYDDALNILDVTEQGEFAAAYDELKADVHVARGGFSQARELYLSALDKRTTAGLDVTVLQMKLDDIGRQ